MYVWVRACMCVYISTPPYGATYGSTSTMKLMYYASNIFGHFFSKMGSSYEKLSSVLYCWSITLSESIYDILCKIIRTWIYTRLAYGEKK